MRRVASAMSSRSRRAARSASSHCTVPRNLSTGRSRVRSSIVSTVSPALTSVSATSQASGRPRASSHALSESCASLRSRASMAATSWAAVEGTRARIDATWAAVTPSPRPGAARSLRSRKRCDSSSTRRWMAAAGLLSSWASPAESLPRLTSLSRCSSWRVNSRDRSSMTAASLAWRTGMRSSISGNRSVEMPAIRVGTRARAVTGLSTRRELGSAPAIMPVGRTIQRSSGGPFSRRRRSSPSSTATSSSTSSPSWKSASPVSNVTIRACSASHRIWSSSRSANASTARNP